MISDKTSPVSGKKGATEQGNQSKKASKPKDDAIWKLSVQFMFTPSDGPANNHVGNLLINHRRRWACANVNIPLTQYPQFVQDLISMEELDEAGLRELLMFFTKLNNTPSLERKE